ncbi:pyridoxamine 5'-phosphate oxidase-domain-containing protein [Crepidotus variabilis]|uniref:Pyridoxamine 5'-phosphate oxidase-domain-containing protein n=1 Tax=Crepidotus variabilis TaxID=179855 RepID=A0A9P6EVA2_9AGAR|nr:pyridoxamine 5'-phosphate oxidase-domain-containing protein [Crepidotus variabilis]
MAAPRWRTILEHGLSKNPEQTAFQLATLDRDASRFNVDVIPRVRSHLYRRFVSSPTAPSTPVIISSTDIRTRKVTQLTTSTKCELAWWQKDPGQQIRIIGDAYLVPSPNHSLYSNFHEKLRNAPIGTGLAALKDKDWEADRVDLFRNMSPVMKAGWCRATPGSKMPGDDEAKTWPKEIYDPEEGNPDKESEKYKEAKRLWDLALSNFATVVIDPLEVDFVDLSDPTHPERFVFRKRVYDGQPVVWEEEAVVP